MNCAESIRLLDGYVDNQLDASSVLALEDHLRRCARCRAREEGLRALREAIHRHTEYRRAPAELRARMAARFSPAAGPAPRAPAWPARRGASIAAFATLLIVGGLWLAAPALRPSTPAEPVAKVVYHISSSDHAGAALRTLGNHLEASPNTKVVVVAHNDGVDFLLRGARDETGALFEDAVRRYHDRGVQFRVCNNTLVRRKIDGEGIIPEAVLVPSGIAEISRLQEKEGYAYMRM